MNRDDAVDLPSKIALALTRRRLHRIPALGPKVIGPSDRFGAMIGRSEPMRGVFRRMEKVAPLRSTVLILGESGTGKGMVAKEIHRQGTRRDQPFIAVSCGMLPAGLLESELFGYERGAFTGAVATKPGLFEKANGGTIFLDEIGTMAAQTQANLLRVLQEREVRRLGDTVNRKVDIRVIAATNLDIDRARKEGTFRTDLFYRLSSVVLSLPPLRERIEDIPILAMSLLQEHCEMMKKPLRRLSPRSIDVLTTYTWPGNVRELKNVMEQAAIFSSHEVIHPEDLSRSVAGLIQEDRPDTLDDLEKRHIATILRRTSGNKVRAARILGIPRSSLYRKLKLIDPDT